MQKIPEGASATRPPSKYAQKVAAEATGIRKPFEFQSTSRSESNSAIVTESWNAPSQAVRVRAIVTETRFQIGVAFLKSEGIESIYLNLNVLRRDYKGKDVRTGFVIECEIAPHPNGKGPRVTRVLSVSPPQPE